MIYFNKYKVEKSNSEKVGWNVFEKIKYTAGNRWVWLWSYDSEQEAKQAIDRLYKRDTGFEEE